MGLFTKRIINGRLKKMNESAFPTSENRPSGDPIQVWFSRYFTIEPQRRPDGSPYKRYYIIKPNLYGEGLQNGALINKYVKNDCLVDNHNDFSLNGYLMDWAEFKNFSSDIYCKMKRCHMIMKYWDTLLKNPLTRAILDKGIRIITPSWLYDGEEFDMVVNPKQAETILDLVGEIVQAETPDDANAKERYADYVISELAKEADRMNVLSASQPTVRIHNYEYVCAKFMAELKEKKDTAKLKIIPLIREKMGKKDVKDSV